MPTPISASQAGSARAYRNDDGSTTVRTGGTVAWRNNNPGNIKYGRNAKAAGAIGKDDKGFAIFPSYEAGFQGMTNVLQNEYGNSTIDAMMKSYAPAFENDTAAYAAFLNNKVGAESSTLVRDLSPDQFNRLQNAIQAFEGWYAGTIGGASHGSASPISNAPIRDLDQTENAERLRGADSWLRPYDAPNVLSPRFANVLSTPGPQLQASPPIKYPDQTVVAQRSLDKGAFSASPNAPPPDARYLVRVPSPANNASGRGVPMLPADAAPSVAPTSFDDRFGNWPSSPQAGAPVRPTTASPDP